MRMGYIGVRVQKIWGLKQPLMDLTFGFEMGPNFEVWFLDWAE